MKFIEQLEPGSIFGEEQRHLVVIGHTMIQYTVLNLALALKRIFLICKAGLSQSKQRWFYVRNFEIEFRALFYLCTDF